jgi:putative transcriptional regulator
MNGVYWGGAFDRVVEMIRSGEMDLNRIRFYIGYSGWGNGQLDEELREKSWLTVQAEPTLVFHANSDEIWKDALKHLGGDYEMMIHFPIDPQLN